MRPTPAGAPVAKASGAAPHRARGVREEVGEAVAEELGVEDRAEDAMLGEREADAGEGEGQGNPRRWSLSTWLLLRYCERRMNQRATMTMRRQTRRRNSIIRDEDLAEDPEGHKSGYVAVIGKPNAGKSTLINAIVGQKLSAVTYKPQTTRHRIVGITSDKHYQMILFDTPGIIERKRNKLEERMMSAVVSSIQAAEAIIAVVDAADQPEEALAMFQPGDNWTVVDAVDQPEAALAMFQPRDNWTGVDAADQAEEALAMFQPGDNWTDRRKLVDFDLDTSDFDLDTSDFDTPDLDTLDLDTSEFVAGVRYKDVCKAEVVFRGSAKNNVGVDEVKAWAVSVLPEGPTLYPKSIVSEQPERFFVSELIREKIFLLYSMEVPYSTQVEIIEFKERRNQKDYISAQILVEKESQVGIIVGKGGAALKRLGRDSREDIEQFLERSVYLELSVKVAADWREKKESLEQFGFYSPSYT
eukprot:gene8037-1271_t